MSARTEVGRPRQRSRASHSSPTTRSISSGEELTLRDALVVRAALAAGCDVLLTRRVEDGTRYVGLDRRGGPDAVAGDGGLVVEDPFE